MISDHLKALTPYVENGFWKLGGKVPDHSLICQAFTTDMKYQGLYWKKYLRTAMA